MIDRVEIDETVQTVKIPESTNLTVINNEISVEILENQKIYIQEISNQIELQKATTVYLTEELVNVIEVGGGSGGVSDHGVLTGLGDDDHAQYLKADGTRALSASWNAGNSITGLTSISGSGNLGIDAGSSNRIEIASDLLVADKSNLRCGINLGAGVIPGALLHAKNSASESRAEMLFEAANAGQFVSFTAKDASGNTFGFSRSTTFLGDLLFPYNGTTVARLATDGKMRFGTFNAPTHGVDSDLGIRSRGAFVRNRTNVVDVNYTVLSTDNVIFYTSLTAARSVTMISAATATNGQEFVIKDTTGNAAANNITINRSGSDTIDGATSYTINTNYGYVVLVKTGTSTFGVIAKG